MFGFKYHKASPNTYILQFRNGRPVREGSGLSFFYFAPSSSLVAVPMQSLEAPFMFQDVSRDFQDVTIQGQVSFRVTDPKKIAAMMNFTLKKDASGWIAEDPVKVPQKVINAVQVQVKSILHTLTLEEILRGTDQIVRTVSTNLHKAEGLLQLGIEISDFSILAIKPKPETSKALEAKVREAILKEADDAVYGRRNSAIEQERAVKENELKTEIAVEQKKREIRETQMDAERAVLGKRQQIQDQEMKGKIKLEEKNKSLVQLSAENAKKQADAKAYFLEAIMKSVADADPKVLQALTLGSADPASIIALAFQGLADNASKVGELNISPDLLQHLLKKKAA
ncbi:MAG: SPFH domain-containing protein [Gammaproteobacteria bacterium]|nr:SPFH domain-containing protein [Gammaproteobacteria bacterium]